MDEIKHLPNVVHNHSKFLEALSTWIKEDFLSSRDDKGSAKLASAAFRECPVWHGAGVYTTSEVFHLAGMWDTLFDYLVSLTSQLFRNFTPINCCGSVYMPVPCSMVDTGFLHICGMVT
jgi:hypothetical protein